MGRFRWARPGVAAAVLGVVVAASVLVGCYGPPVATDVRVEIRCETTISTGSVDVSVHEIDLSMTHPRWGVAGSSLPVTDVVVAGLPRGGWSESWDGEVTLSVVAGDVAVAAADDASRPLHGVHPSDGSGEPIVLSGGVATAADGGTPFTLERIEVLSWAYGRPLGLVCTPTEPRQPLFTVEDR
jgi:hypothetical protein